MSGGVPPDQPLKTNIWSKTDFPTTFAPATIKMIQTPLATVEMSQIVEDVSQLLL